MQGFTLVTGSEHKANEYRLMLPDVQIDTMSADVDEMQSLDLKEIAGKKARAAFAVLKRPAVVDDTGFFLEHFKGFPGTFIKYFEDVLSKEALILLLQDAENRRGYAETCIAYYDGEKEIVACGRVEGTITHELRGPMDAFGFDNCFVPDGYEETYAELGIDVKSNISHRANALKAFREEYAKVFG